MNRQFATGALLSIIAATATSTAHADGNRYVLPVCYGNNFQVDTMLRPSGFQSLRCLPISGGESCSWFISTSGTRPTHDYVIVAKTPSTPPSPPPIPQPPSSIVAAGAIGTLAAGPAPAPARLSWPSGTAIPAFRSSSCASAWAEDLDTSLVAVLAGSPTDDDLVFALDAGRAPHDAPVVSTAFISEMGGCQGTLATQQLVNGVWSDVVSAVVTPAPRYYMQHAPLAPGKRVRLVLRATGTCTVRDLDIFIPSDSPQS